MGGTPDRPSVTSGTRVFSHTEYMQMNSARGANSWSLVGLESNGIFLVASVLYQQEYPVSKNSNSPAVWD